jgi:hypothetical protein
VRSPISSRNSVEPLAASKRPILRESAPVKEPFSCPKSSLSSRFSGIAAQFSAKKGRADRFDRAWIARATSSLPVPDSPRMRTVEFVGAIFSTSRKTSRIAALSPTIASRPSLLRRRSRRSVFSASRNASRARSTRKRSSSATTGLDM